MCYICRDAVLQGAAQGPQAHVGYDNISVHILETLSNSTPMHCLQILCETHRNLKVSQLQNCFAGEPSNSVSRLSTGLVNALAHIKSARRSAAEVSGPGEPNGHEGGCYLALCHLIAFGRRLTSLRLVGYFEAAGANALRLKHVCARVTNPRNHSKWSHLLGIVN